MATKKKTATPAPRMSLLKAAEKILGETEEAMNAKSIVEAAKSKGLWSPGEGKTPEQTLYSAIVREIKVKGATARFTAVGHGLFKLNAGN